MHKLVYPNNSIYFLTGSTFLHYPYFKEDIQKQILLNQFRKINKKLKVSISSYSIAVNHYHIIFYLEQGNKLSKIKQLIHGGTSFEYKKHWPIKHRDFWQSSKIFLVNTEESYWKIIGYIIGNLLKHKEISTFNELKENSFTSYFHIASKYGDLFAQELVYGVIDINEDQEGFVNLKKLKETKVSIPPAKAG